MKEVIAVTEYEHDLRVYAEEDGQYLLRVFGRGQTTHPLDEERFATLSEAVARMMRFAVIMCEEIADHSTGDTSGEIHNYENVIEAI